MRKRWLLIIILIIGISIFSFFSMKSFNFNINNNKTQFFISNDQYYQAIKDLNGELARDERVVDTFTKMNPSISQLYINGEQQYIVAWNNFGYTSSLIIFIKDDETFIPIYLTQPGDSIDAIKTLDLGLDINFIEITSFFSTGGHMAQQVKILSLQGKTTNETWDYKTISTDSNGNSTHKSYSTYTIVPQVFSLPCIYVHQINNANGIEEEINITYKWDDKLKKFQEV